jgi:hypothetical protein
MRAAVILALVGCSFEHGSLSGDASVSDVAGATDAAIDAGPPCDIHDFDGDGLGDACDLCPHIPSANANMDDDEAGDECDPRPLSPGEHRALWLAFYDAADINGWANTGNGGTWSVSNNLLHQTKNTNFALLDSPLSYSTDQYFAVSAQMVDQSSNEIGFCLSDIQPSQQYYCCAASNAAGPSVRAASQYSTSGTQIQSVAGFAGNLSAGQHVEMTGTLIGSQFKCQFTQDQAVSNAMTAAGGRVGPACFYATTKAEYRYIFLLTIGS